MRPEPGAVLDHLAVRSPQPERLAAYFTQLLGTTAGRATFCAGAANTIEYFAFGFDDEQQLASYRSTLLSRGVPVAGGPPSRAGANAFSVTDPDGNRAVFCVRQPVAAADPPARLQHIVFRTHQPERMLRHYAEALGFVLSDRVQDDAGTLRACFLRSDAEHHSLAFFLAPQARLDHHSYETAGWDDLRRRADQAAAARIPLVWGVGRHGPGNDLFFMVKHPDGNLVEISTELEICAADRPAGVWKHEERTLNLWGAAIMRS